MKLLEDVSPEGPLHLIATYCHNIIKQRGLKRVDFSNPGRRKEVRACSAAICVTILIAVLLSVALQRSYKSDMPQQRDWMACFLAAKALERKRGSVCTFTFSYA